MVAGWWILLRNSDVHGTLGFCGFATASDRWQLFLTQLVLTPPGTTIGAWIAMTMAMTPPSLDLPLATLERACGRLRPLMIALFASTFAMVWIVTGFLLTMLADFLLIFLGQPAGLASVSATGIALVWTLRRVFRRGDPWRGTLRHYRDRLITGAHYGLRTGIQCVSDCWAVMLVALTTAHFHLMAMGIITLMKFSQQIVEELIPGWEGWRTVYLRSMRYSHDDVSVSDNLRRHRSRERPAQAIP